MRKPRFYKVVAALAILSAAAIQPTPASAADARKCTITGTAGNDVLAGTAGNDVICGLGGDDIIQGGKGNDVIYAGAGNDKVIGGDGADTIYGEAGADAIFGDNGNDKLSGGPARDLISGGAGKDNISDSQSTDTCAWDPADIQGKCKFDRTAPSITPMFGGETRFAAGTTATFSWRATDSSGIEDSWLTIGGPSGWVTKWCDFVVPSKRVEGDAKNGVYSAKCDIPQTAPNLTYSAFLSSRDYMGNVATSAQGIDFSVYGGSSDVDAPTFEFLSGPSSVSAGSKFEVSWHSTDATDVGFSGIYFAYQEYSFSNGFVSYVSATGPNKKISGTDKDCVFSQEFTVNADAPASYYTLWSTRADSLGNKAFDKTAIQIAITR